MTNTNNFDLPNKAIQASYQLIKSEMIDVFRSYPAAYRTYIEIKDNNVGDQPDFTFFNPLFALHLQKADNDFYLEFTLYKESFDANKSLTIIRSILKHTDKANTSVDIEYRVTQSLDEGENYYTILKEFFLGATEYQPRAIEPLMKEA